MEFTNIFVSTLAYIRPAICIKHSKSFISRLFMSLHATMFFYLEIYYPEIQNDINFLLDQGEIALCILRMMFCRNML